MILHRLMDLLPVVHAFLNLFRLFQEQETVRQRAHEEEIAYLRRNRRRIANLLINRRSLNKRRRRTCWVQRELVTPTRYWEEIIPNLSNERFQKKMRLSRETFNQLVDDLRPYLSKMDTKLRQAIPVGKRIAIALTILKSNADFWTVADLFGVGKSTVGYILHDVCEVVSTHLYRRYVQFPHTPQRRQEIADGFFLRWQFPGVVGALDGTHIPIIAPSFCHEDYVNYKNYHSTVLLGLVDHEYKFIYTNIGKPGRANDASIFAASQLKEYVDTNFGEDQHILGDGAFPLLSWLLVPFTQSAAMTATQKNYNYRLSRARMSVENAFGRLKGRWRILLKRCDMSLPHMINIIKTCIVLHNICENNSDRFNLQWNELVQNANELYPQPNYNHPQRQMPVFASVKRNHIAEHLANDGVYFNDI